MSAVPLPEASAEPEAAPPRLSLGQKLAFGSGAVAFGVRDIGFNSFLLIFYNQVLGVPAGLAGLALLISLLVDAVVDPLVGSTSDNWRSRLGRRHPFMLAAALPASMAFWLLWHPPAGLASGSMFAWLLGFSILTRWSVSLFEVPFVAMATESTRDYDERTTLMTWLQAFGWWSGLTLAVLTYGVFLRPTPADPTGMLNREGFATFGTIASFVLLAAILAPALATRGLIPRLAAAPVARPGLAEMFRTYRRLLQNRSVQALMLSVVFLVTSQGFGQGLYNYIQVYIWGLTSSQISLLALAPFISATLAFVFTPRLARGREKRTLAIGLGLIAVVGQPTPLMLRLAGLFPGPDSPWMLPLLTFHSAFESLVWVMFAILASSMMADLVEETQGETGRPTEGSLFALRILADKAVSGFGVLLSGLVLEFVGFPVGAPAGTVQAATISHLALTYAPLTVALGVSSALCLLGYRVTRQGHVRNLTAISPRGG